MAGTFGFISTTPLNDGEVILILTKIKGNVAPGLGVLTVTIDGQEYALETPERLEVVLAQVAGYDLEEVEYCFINGEGSPLDQLVGSGDQLAGQKPDQLKFIKITHIIHDDWVIQGKPWNFREEEWEEA